MAVLVVGAVALGLVAPAPPPVGAETNEAPPTFVRAWGIDGSGLPGTPQIADPDGIVVDGAGNVYVTDDTERIQKFAPDGTRLAVFGGPGSAPGEFRYLGDLTIGTNGNLYTLEPCGGAACPDRVQQLTTAGVPVTSFPASASTSATDLATDAAGNVYVASRVPRQVQKYAPNGTLVAAWPLQDTLSDPQAITVAPSGQVFVGDDSNDRVEVYTATGDFVRMFGTSGAGDGHLANIGAISVDGNGHAFVLDVGHDRLQEFDQSGAFVATWGTSGSGDGQFSVPNDLTRGPDGNVWVLDEGLDRVQRFSPTGAFVAKWGSYGDGGPQFEGPQGIARDGAGNIYVADTGNDRIQKLDPNGTHLLSWGTTGTGNGQFRGPADVDIAAGSVFVSDRLNNRVQRFSLDGVFQAAFGSGGSGGANLSSPRGLDVVDGLVYIADESNNRVQVFDTAGTRLRQLSVGASPDAVAVDREGNVLVATGGSIVQRFTPTGTPLPSWDLGKLLADTDADGIEVDPAGNIWIADNQHDDALKLRPDGTEMARVPINSPFLMAPIVLNDFAFGADRRVLVVSEGRGSTSQGCCVAPGIYELQGQTGALVDVTLSVDEVAASVGDPLHFHLKVRNTGTVTLTGVTSSSTSVPECAGPVAGVAPSTTIVVDCTHTAAPGEDGQFSATATVATNQGAQASTNTVTIPIGAERPPVLTRTYDVAAGVWGFSKRGIDTSPDGTFSVGAEFGGSGEVRRFNAAGTSTFSLSVGAQLSDNAQGPGGDTFAGVVVAPSPGGEDGRVRRYTPAGALTSTFDVAGQNGAYTGVDVDETGRVFASEMPNVVCANFDVLNHCTGNRTVGTSQVVRFAADGLSSLSLGAPGSGDGQLANPSDVAVSGAQVYVADTGNDRIVTFTTEGAFVRNLPLEAPSSVATAPDGTLYAASSRNGLVEAYAPDGSLLASWQTPASSTQRLATDTAGRVWVLDVPPSKVRVYEPGGQVVGSVTETGTGNPVGGAFVAVLRASDFSIVGTDVADASGAYSATTPAGSYYAYAVDPTGAHVAGFAGSPTAVTVPVNGEATANAVLAATRGTISGTVTDQQTGNPVAGASVVVTSTSGEAQRVVTANGAGAYTVPGLAAGNHLVAFFDPSGAHGPEFFPDAPSAPSATPVAVTGGGNTTANGALLAQAPAATGATLSGVVTAPAPAGGTAPLAATHVIVLRAADLSFVRSGVTNGAGQYSIAVPVGSYKLAFVDSAGANAVEWHDNQPFYGLGAAASVTAPAVTNATLARSTGSISGVVSAVNVGPWPAAWVIAIGPSGVAGAALPASNGSYQINGLPPGSYRVTFVDTAGGRPQEYWRDASSYATATPVAVSTTVSPGGVNASLG